MIKVIIVDTEKLPVTNSQNCSQVCTTTFCITPCWCGGQQSLLALGKPIEEYYKWLDEMAGKWYNDMANGRITISLSQYLIQEGKK